MICIKFHHIRLNQLHFFPLIVDIYIKLCYNIMYTLANFFKGELSMAYNAPTPPPLSLEDQLTQLRLAKALSDATTPTTVFDVKALSQERHLPQHILSLQLVNHSMGR